mgnify:CR=1 FL=1
MQCIAHRINTIRELAALPEEYGVELDLRDSLDGRIYISHNPFEPGDDFEEYLRHYHHGLMILNIKSERIELKILEMLKQHKIQEYFFLDSSFPMIYLLSGQGEKNLALRLSEYEGMDTIRNMAGRANWVWVDCFTKLPVDHAGLEELRRLGYKTCLVSPELQGRPEDVEPYAAYLRENALRFDAVCAKANNMKMWESVHLCE